jgi:4a-hydroxytetrahydrobiopterin dehydratase
MIRNLLFRGVVVSKKYGHNVIHVAATSPTVFQQRHSFVTATRPLLQDKPKRLSDDAVKASIKILSKNSPLFPWERSPEGKAIRKTFYFTDFNTAWSFMSRVALLAERVDHHPEWFNVYNRVDVTLTTHDCDGVSDQDIAMAKAMEEYANSLMPSGPEIDES